MPSTLVIKQFPEGGFALDIDCEIERTTDLHDFPIFFPEIAACMRTYRISLAESDYSDTFPYASRLLFTHSNRMLLVKFRERWKEHISRNLVMFRTRLSPRMSFQSVNMKYEISQQRSSVIKAFCRHHYVIEYLVRLREVGDHLQSIEATLVRLVEWTKFIELSGPLMFLVERHTAYDSNLVAYKHFLGFRSEEDLIAARLAEIAVDGDVVLTEA